MTPGQIYTIVRDDHEIEVKFSHREFRKNWGYLTKTTDLYPHLRIGDAIAFLKKEIKA